MCMVKLYGKVVRFDVRITKGWLDKVTKVLEGIRLGNWTEICVVGRWNLSCYG